MAVNLDAERPRFSGAPESWRAWLLTERSRRPRADQRQIDAELAALPAPRTHDEVPFVAVARFGEDARILRMCASWALEVPHPVDAGLREQVDEWLRAALGLEALPPFSLACSGPGRATSWDGDSCGLAAVGAVVSLLARWPVRAGRVISGALGPRGLVADVGEGARKRARVEEQWPGAELRCWEAGAPLPRVGADALDEVLEPGWRAALDEHRPRHAARVSLRLPRRPLRLGALRLLAPLSATPDGGAWRALHDDGGEVAVEVRRAGRVAEAALRATATRLAAARDPRLLPVYATGRVSADAAAPDEGLVEGDVWWATALPVGSLADRVLPWDELRVVLADVLGALASARAVGEGHGAGDPARVLLRDGGGAWLSDLEGGPTAPDLAPVARLAATSLDGPAPPGWTAWLASLTEAADTPWAARARLLALPPGTASPERALLPAPAWADAALRALPFVGREDERRTLLAAVAEGRPALIVGPPGSGRGALARWVRQARAVLGEGPPVPLLDAPSTGPALVPCTSRVATCWPDLPRVDVGPLPEDELRGLGRAAGADEEDLARACERAEGWPGVLLALLADPAEVPGALRERWTAAARQAAARGGDGVERALRVAALLGREVPLDLWRAALAGLDAPPPPVDALEEAGLLVPAGEGRVRFPHAGMRALFGEDARASREHAALHDACAAALAGADTAADRAARAGHLRAAGHLGEAGRAFLDAALAWLDQSDYGRAAGALDEADACVRAVDLPAADPMRGALLGARLRVHFGFGRAMEAATAARALMEEARRHRWAELRAFACRHLGMVQARQRQDPTEHLRDALALAQRLGVPREEARARLHLGTWRRRMGDPAWAEDVRAAMALFQDAGDDHGQADCWLELAPPGGDEARRCALEALGGFQRAGNHFGLARTHTLLGELARSAQDRVEARRHHEQAARLLERIQSSRLAFALANLGTLDLDEGDWARARQRLEAALRAVGPAPSPDLAVLCAAGLLSAVAELGDPAAAPAWLERFEQAAAAPASGDQEAADRAFEAARRTARAGWPETASALARRAARWYEKLGLAEPAASARAFLDTLEEEHAP